MDLLSETDIAGLPVDGPSPRPERPVRLFGLALVWLVAASAAAWVWAFAIEFAIALVVDLHNDARFGFAHVWHVAKPSFTLLMLLGADLVLVFAGWRRGAAVGGGDARAGLGFGPIRRPGLLVAFATLGEAAAFGWAVVVYFVLQPRDHGVIATLLGRILHASVLEQAAILFCVVVLSPLWEEFFFRGWLWTGLRRYWGVLPVMIATTLPWLLLHSFDGLLRPLYLLPMGVMLCLARQYCGGIRASIALHVLNNLIVMGPVIFLRP
jgi:membrane protease YdiL (CAAX protease family)